MVTGERRKAGQAFPALIPVPKLSDAKVAVQLATTAKQDLRAAKVLYENGLCPQAVYMLQQSVEKAVKSFGLMLGLVKSKRLRDISHRTVYVLFNRIENFSRYMGGSLTYLGTATDSDVNLLREIGGNILVNGAAKLIPSDAKIRADRFAIKNLDEGVMWKDTLNLSRDNEAVREALEGLENFPFEKAGFSQIVEAMAKAVGSSKTQYGAYATYNLGMLRASPRTYSLSMITMWHEMPTRYPPTTRLDYWRWGQYTLEKPLLKEFPQLLHQTGILCKGVLMSARASVRLAKQPPFSVAPLAEVGTTKS
jgi:hypothetical protein